MNKTSRPKPIRKTTANAPVILPEPLGTTVTDVTFDDLFIEVLDRFTDVLFKIFLLFACSVVITIWACGWCWVYARILGLFVVLQ